MYRYFLGLLVFILWPSAWAGAETSNALPNQEQAAIRTVIESQLAAFQRDDGVGAFSFASPTIRERFRTPEIFMTMVRSGYRAVYRPREVEFRDLRLVEGTPAQEILFVGPDNQAVVAVYLMEKQPDGSWKINGVYLVKSTEATT